MYLFIFAGFVPEFLQIFEVDRQGQTGEDFKELLVCPAEVVISSIRIIPLYLQGIL